jgi:hypothetical protein
MLRHYKEASDFRWLWSKQGVDEMLDPRPSTLLHICWDGFPEGIELPRLPLSPHLTPFDWVVSFARRASRKGTLPDLRVAISRPWIGGGIMEREGCFGPLLAHTIHGAFPWLRLFDRPEQVSDVSDNWPSLRTAAPWKGAAEALAQGWVGNLARSVSHHDVNNALGPLLLLTGLSQPAPSHPGLDALLQHATRLQLAASGEIASRASVMRPATIARDIAARHGGTLRLVLIDDQINNGWARVVAALLGLTLEERRAAGDAIQRLSRAGPVELWGAERIDPLVALLEENSYADSRFGLRLTDSDVSGPDTVSEILLLDLRLAFEADGEKGMVRSALARIAKAAKLYDDSGLSERAWGVPLLAPLATDLDPSDDTQRQLDLLTLPTRTVATADVALPIIIFSSTGQRTVVETLKPYRNVSTRFEKPQVLGYRPAHVSNDTALKFADALADAAAVLESRRIVEWLGTPAPLAQALPSEKHDLNIDIYVDETGSEFDDAPRSKSGKVTLAAVVAVQSGRRAYQYAYDSEARRLVASKLREAGGNPDRTKGKLRRDAKRVTEILERSGCSLVTLSFEPKKFERTASVDDPFYSDFLYREIMSDLLEYIIYHHARDLAGNRSVTARIHLPTRIRPADPAECRLEDEYWGRNSKDGRIYLVSPNDCLPVAQRISSYYPRSGVRVTRARCFEINNFSRRWNIGLHYLADAVANRTFEENESLIHTGAYGAVTPAVRSLLRAARDARNGAIPEALVRANELIADLEQELTDNDRCREPHLVSRLKSCLALHAEAMTGSQFGRCFDMIRQRAN